MDTLGLEQGWGSIGHCGVSSLSQLQQGCQDSWIYSPFRNKGQKTSRTPCRAHDSNTHRTQNTQGLVRSSCAIGVPIDADFIAKDMYVDQPSAKTTFGL